MALSIKLTQKRRHADYYQRIQLLAQQSRVKVSGLVSLTLFTIAFFGIFAILPTFKTIAQLTKKIKDEQLVTDKLEKKILALDKAQEVYAQVVDEMVLLDQVLPEKVEFERLAWQIQWLAVDNQVKINNGRFGGFPVKNRAATNNSEVKPIEIELSLIGQYSNIRKFAAELGKIDRLILIKQITINRKSGEKQSNKVTASIKAQAYYLPKQK
jgi:Tfp pilus assembly protein PilO